jgi:hypothetical protein
MVLVVYGVLRLPINALFIWSGLMYVSPGVGTYKHLKITHREKKSAKENSMNDFQ